MFRSGTHADSRFGRASDDDGFTMIEAVVSFTIFAIVIAAAVLAIVAGIKTSNNNRDRVAAANVAQQALAQAQVAPAASLTASAGPSSMPTATKTMTSTVGNEPYTVVRKVDFAQQAASATATSGATGCPTSAATTTTGPAVWMHIAVTVTWPGSNSSVQMDTVRSC